MMEEGSLRLFWAIGVPSKSHMSLSFAPCLLYTHLNPQTLWLHNHIYNHQDNVILFGYQIGVEYIQVHLPRY